MWISVRISGVSCWYILLLVDIYTVYSHLNDLHNTLIHFQTRVEICEWIKTSFPKVVYMVWNAVNDPLFGYLQDNSRVPCCSQRRLSILYGAPLYSLAFLLAWFPWRSYAPGDWLSGLHLTVALCAFDGLLTFVLLAQCALFAEISSHHQNRIRLIKYSQVRNYTNISV